MLSCMHSLIEVVELLQKLKTRTVEDNCNPEWNEELTLAIKNLNEPVNLVNTVITLLDSKYINTPLCF